MNMSPLAKLTVGTIRLCRSSSVRVLLFRRCPLARVDLRVNKRERNRRINKLHIQTGERSGLAVPPPYLSSSARSERGLPNGFRRFFAGRIAGGGGRRLRRCTGAGQSGLFGGDVEALEQLLEVVAGAERLEGGVLLQLAGVLEAELHCAPQLAHGPFGVRRGQLLARGPGQLVVLPGDVRAMRVGGGGGVGVLHRVGREAGQLVGAGRGALVVAESQSQLRRRAQVNR